MATDYFNTFSKEELLIEEWKSIVGWEGWYSISNLGRVRRDKGTKKSIGNYFIKPAKTNNGYFRVTLTRPGYRCRYSIHRLVLIAFYGDSDLVSNHIDGNKENNRVCNLEWVSQAENNRHALRIGLRKQNGDDNPSRRHPERLARGNRSGSVVHIEKRPRGSSHWNSTLNESDINKIREMLANGLKCTKIGKQFNVSANVILNIKHGKTWRHVK